MITFVQLYMLIFLCILCNIKAEMLKNDKKHSKSIWRPLDFALLFAGLGLDLKKKFL